MKRLRSVWADTDVSPGKTTNGVSHLSPSAILRMFAHLTAIYLARLYRVRRANRLPASGLFFIGQTFAFFQEENLV